MKYAQIRRYLPRKFSTQSKPKIAVLKSNTNDILFNLATEEWIFREMDPACQTFFLWRNSPTVVIGKHQNPWKECHVTKMDEDNVVLARRQSGGGAVYQDLGNSCFTYLSSHDAFDMDTNFNILIDALKQFNINAVRSGRNDVLVGARKISGSAFKHTHDRSFHHGTVLLNTDLDALQKYLNPNKAKLLSKGVESVKSRVMNLSEMYPKIKHENLCEALIQQFFKAYKSTCEIKTLDHDELKKIESLNKIYKEYSDWNWRFGKTPPFQINYETRFDWGIMDVHLSTNRGVIEELKIYSDSLHPLMIDELMKNLKGADYGVKGITEACDKTKLKMPDCVKYIEDFKVWLVKCL